MSKTAKRAPRARTISYEMECDVSLEMEILLERGKLDQVVTDGDCSSGKIWFEGLPGRLMRAFREEMIALSKVKPVPGGTPESARLVRKFSRIRAARQALGR